MSDAPQDSPPPATDNAPPIAPLRFLGQFIRDLSFEAPLAPEIFNNLRDGAPEMTITIDAAARQIEGPTFDVTISVQLEAKIVEKTAFILELVYGCVVELNAAVVPPEYAHSLVLIEVPRHLFPFVRQIVAETTGAGGFPPVMLQMVDFADLYRRKFAPQAAAGQEPGPAPAVH
ncbi:MAG: protein-export chaperone SecB [Rhodospirillaceae bacterium]|nr:protein-export chaperone SecB [Rhodospirillaceae bacterium]